MFQFGKKFKSIVSNFRKTSAYITLFIINVSLRSLSNVMVSSTKPHLSTEV